MTSRSKRAAAAAEAADRPAAIAAAVESLRAAFVRSPLLLLHDVALPSATAAIAGPIAGSWSAHPSGAVIFAALAVIAPDVAQAKLVSGKITLIDRALWPALIAIGRAEATWQMAGLRPEARALFAHVSAVGSARTDHLRATGDGAAIGRAVEQLERRLLVASHQVHTATGHHARELSTWRRWQHQVGLATSPLPSAEEARAQFEEVVGGWAAGDAALPWQVGGGAR